MTDKIEQRLFLQTSKYIKQKEYWLTRLSGDFTGTRLTCPPAAAEGGRPAAGKPVNDIDGPLFQRLLEISKNADLSLYIMLLAALKALMYRYFDCSDITVLSPVYSPRVTADTLTDFVWLRNRLHDGMTFRELILEIRQSVLEAYENQDYPLKELLGNIGGGIHDNGQGLSNILISLGGIHSEKSNISGTDLVRFRFDRQTDRLAVDIQFDPLKIDGEFIRQLYRHYYRILDRSVNDIHGSIAHIPFLSEAEQRRLVFDLNDTGADFPGSMTLHGLVEERAAGRPDNVVVVHGDLSVTSGELAARCEQLAARLANEGIGPETPVALIFNRSPEMIMGMISVLKAGGAYLPIDPGSPENRVQFMLRESGAGIVLSLDHRQAFEVKRLTGEVSSPHYPNFDPEPARTNRIAYIIYTSGSTGRPKGVTVAHRSGVNVVTWFGRQYRLDSDTRILQMTGYTFDASINQIFGALSFGARLFIIETALIAEPDELRRFIRSRQIHILNFIPSVLTDLLSGSEKLNSIRAVICGGEKLVPAAGNALIEKGYPVFNQYGPTETTIDALWEECGLDDFSLGRPIANAGCYILNRRGEPLPAGVAGELAVSGAGIARGYLNNPELTAERFTFYRRLGDLSVNRVLYHSGDLCRRGFDGKIEFLGRQDDQVKISGYRIEPAEIESLLLEYEGIKEAAVVPVEATAGMPGLCCYFVPTAGNSGRFPAVRELREYLSRRLPDYMIPGFFMELKRLPLTVHYKIDRSALPAPLLRDEDRALPPRDGTERRLAEIFSAVLAGDKRDIYITSSFFALGGQSLKATRLIARIFKEMGVNVPLTQVFTTPDIEGLAAYIRSARKEEFQPVRAVEKKSYYPLSSAQMRLFILQQIDADYTGYNMPMVLELAGQLDIKRLRKTFRLLIARHESLRTAFVLMKDRPVQRVHDRPEFEIEYDDRCGGEDGKGLISRFIRPFPLDRAPLLRVKLVKRAVDLHHLLLDMHHIICDGSSLAVVVSELMAFYAGSPPVDPGVQYKDYACWLAAETQAARLQHQEAFWIDRFADDIPVLNLPLDHARPPVQSFDGRHLYFEVDGRETALLKRAAAETDVSLFMLLLALLNVWLTRMCGQEDIVVGVPHAGRRHDDVQSVVGMFVNTLALRNQPAADKTFGEFLQEVRENTMAAFDNQDYQFEDLVDKLEINRDSGRNPLFDVMFAFQNIDIPRLELPGLTLESLPFESGISKFDLTLHGREVDDKLEFVLEYGSRLFRRQTMQGWSSRFLHLIHHLTEQPDRDLKISRLEIVDRREMEEILRLSTGPEETLSPPATIHGLFEERAAGWRDRAALIFQDMELSYHCLNGRANRLARYLRAEKGVEPGRFVGLTMAPSLRLIVCLLAILKAGAAYLPIDTDSPPKRVRTILEESGCSVVFGEEETPAAALEDLSPRNPRPVNDSSDLVYLIYTSGSTGRPKGVMLEHRNLLNLIVFQFKYSDIDFSRVLQFASIAFDVSFQEIFSTLLAGGRLYLIPREMKTDVEALSRFIENRCIATLFLPPSFLKFVFSQPAYAHRFPVTVRHIVTAGEQVKIGHRFRRYLQEKGVYLHNHYGPSETHVVTTLTLDPRREIPEVPAIGRPVLNTRIYILDRDLNILPSGAAGEIYIGGAQVGRGYLDRVELTDRRFRTDPFEPTGRVYRSGDLARWLGDGTVQFLGRTDHQVKIRGFRVEPGEIVAQLSGHPSVRETAVVVRHDEQGDLCLAAYVVPDSTGLPVSLLREYLSGKLPPYMIPAYFIQLEALPLTISGKLDRLALPPPEAVEHQKNSVPLTGPETQLAGIWAEVLHIDPAAIGADSNFFELGGHSLKATLLIARIRETFHRSVALKDVFLQPTLRGLGRQLQLIGSHRSRPLRPVEERGFFELSYNQKRLWLLQRLAPRTTAYHLSSRFVLRHRVERDHIRRVIECLVDRHESLRTGFLIIDGEPAQRVKPGAVVPFHYLDVSGLGGEERQRERSEFILPVMSAPFELEQPPLLRAALVKISAEEFELVFTMHHLISDGWSLEMLRREFVLIYDSLQPGTEVDLKPMRIRYRDFAVWHNRLLEDESAMAAAVEFWKSRLAGEMSPLDLPYDYPKRNNSGRESNGYRAVLSKSVTGELRELAAQQRATLFMVLVAGFYLMLSRVTGQPDIMIGVPAASRRHADLRGVMGFFVNTLAVRQQVEGADSFLAFLERLQQNILQVLEYQDYPLELICSEQKIAFPDISVFFNMINIGEGPLERLENTDSYHTGEVQEAKFEMVFYLREYENGIEIMVHYYKDLFSPSTIERLTGIYGCILENMVRHPMADLSACFGGKKRKIIKQKISS